MKYLERRIARLALDIEMSEKKLARDIEMSEKKLAIHSAFHSERIKDLKREAAMLRLMNDIRLGKIIPVIAETGTVADVTFS